MDDRRRVPRHDAVWMGSCSVEGETSGQWQDCGVFDFSALGIGMDFRFSRPAELVGLCISVRLPVGGSVDMTLTGRVRNAKPGPGGIVRVGMEFDGLSEDELYIIDLLALGTLSVSMA